VNTVQHFCTYPEVRLYNDVAIISPVWASFLPPLSFTHTDLLAHPPIYWSPARDFKGLAFGGIHSNS